MAFRKSTLYEKMKWSSAVESTSRNSLFCAAQFGGPVAIAYTHDASMKVQRSFPIVTYTASGQQIGKIQWQNGELLDIAWSNAEDLLCLQKDGRVFVYNMFGLEQRSRQFGMGNVAQLGITESRSFDSYAGSGLAVLTTSHQFFIVNNVDDPKVWRTPEIPRKAEKPSCWAVVSKGRKTKVIAVFGADIFSLAQGLAAEQIMPNVPTPVGRYVRIAVSQDQSKLALLSENGLVQFTSVEMKQTFCETTIDLSDSLPVDFLWCGSEALAVLENETSLALLGLDGGSIRFAFDQPVRFGAEVDGIRLFSQSTLEFIAKVPDPVCAIYQVASNEPGALLLEASGKYKEGSHQAYDYLRMIGDRLQQAVEQCIAAAGHEFDIASQRALIEAAAFGKTFARDMNAQSFVDMCRVLRVLNAIRERHFGISLTYEQLSKLTVAVLVDRLIARAQWPLVIAVCQHLRIPPEDGVNRVLGHWACQKIEELRQNRAAGRAAVDSAKLADVICRKFREFPGVSYADVAQKAQQCELNELATLLLENEPQIDRQVRMLLKLDQRQKALSRATDSGDPDLIYLVILKLKQAMDKAELDLMLRKFPEAFALYTQLLREEAPNHLLALYRQEDDFCGQALFQLDNAKAVGTFDVREKQTCLAEAERCMSAVKEDCYGQLLNDSVKLLKHQAQYEEQFGQPFTELSLRSTIVWLVEHGEHVTAESLRKEFRVSDKQFWWWKIEGLGKGGRWQELETFAKAKKSPIGYLPFVEVCVKYKHMSEWKKYLQKMSSYEHQVIANIKTGDLTNAANIAFQNNDDNLLNRVMSHCGPQSRGLSEQIVSMKQELAKKSGK